MRFALVATLLLATGCFHGPLSGVDAVEQNNTDGAPRTAAILWRTGCAACSVSTDNPEPADGGAEEARRLALQHVDLAGDVATGFTLALPEQPTAFVLDTFMEYPTGLLVFTDGSDVVTLRNEDRLAFDYPLLFDDEIASLAITAVTPFYITFVDGPDRISSDMSLDGGQSCFANCALTPGYHASKLDADTVRRSVSAAICSDVGGTDCPPNNVYGYQHATPVDLSASLTFDPESRENLVDILAGVDPSTL